MILAVLRPDYRYLLDPDACGGRAPRGHQRICANGCGSYWCEETRSTDASPRCQKCDRVMMNLAAPPGLALVLHDSRDPVIGRRGLACAADAVAAKLGWEPGACSPVWWIESLSGVWIVVLVNGKDAQKWSRLDVPTLAAYTDRVRAGVTPEVLALCVGAVGVHFGIFARIEEVTL